MSSTAADVKITSIQLGGPQATDLHPTTNSRSGVLNDIHDSGTHAHPCMYKHPLLTFLASDGSSQSQPVAGTCLLYTSPSPRDATLSRMPSSA